MEPIVLIASATIPRRPQHFDALTRFTQVRETIASVRTYIPNAHVILIEGTVIPDEWKAIYANEANEFLDVAQEMDIAECVHDTRNIGIGEHRLLERGVDHIIHMQRTCQLLLKLGARYVLNDHFALEQFSLEAFTFRPEWSDWVQRQTYVTGLYGIPYTRLNEWKTYLIATRRMLFDGHSRMVEEAYARIIPIKDVHTIPELGYTGRLSYNGTIIEK